MELHKLQTFIAAAEHGNFGRAAEALGVRQPTVSRHVRDLEEKFAVLLFERHPAGVRLTPAGRAVLDSARAALQILSDAAFDAAGASQAERGEVRLGVLEPPLSGRLAEFIAEHGRRWPEVDLSLCESHHFDLHRGLMQRRLDAAFLIDQTIAPDLEALPLWRERLVAAVPAAGALADKPAVTWADLARETYLAQGWPGFSVPRELAVQKLGVNVRIRQHLVSQHGVLALVGAGYGVTIVFEMIAGVPVPGVAFRPIAELDASTGLFLAWRKGADEPILGRFVAFVRDELKASSRAAAPEPSRLLT